MENGRNSEGHTLYSLEVNLSILVHVSSTSCIITIWLGRANGNLASSSCSNEIHRFACRVLDMDMGVCDEDDRRRLYVRCIDQYPHKNYIHEITFCGCVCYAEFFVALNDCKHVDGEHLEYWLYKVSGILKDYSKKNPNGGNLYECPLSNRQDLLSFFLFSFHNSAVFAQSTMRPLMNLVGLWLIDDIDIGFP